jgi:hypothetical protein
MHPEFPAHKPRADQQELVRLAEWEIKRLEDAKKEQGWNPWILTAALAGLVWKSVDEFSQPHLWVHVCLYWAAFTLIANLVKDVMRMLMAPPREAKPASPRFFSANRLLSGTRPHLLFSALQIVGAALVVVLSPAVQGTLRIILVVLFSFYLVTFVVALSLSFSDFPYSASIKRAHTAVKRLDVVSSLLNVAAMLFISWKTWLLLAPSFALSDMKLGLMLFAASEMIGLLLSQNSVNPIRDNLVQLRRAMGLGEIEHEDAKAHLDMALHGVEISRYLQPQVQAFLSLLNQAIREQDAVSQLVRAANDKCGGAPTDEQESLIRAYVNEADRRIQTVQSLLTEAGQSISAFNLRVGVVSATDARIEEDVRTLRERMCQQLTVVREKQAEFTRSMEMLRKAGAAFIQQRL